MRPTTTTPDGPVPGRPPSTSGPRPDGRTGYVWAWNDERLRWRDPAAGSSLVELTAFRKRVVVWSLVGPVKLCRIVARQWFRS